MISGHEDQFVGIVSAALGLFLLTAAALNWQWYYQVRTARLLEARFGRAGARCVHALVGFGLIALGIAVANGCRWPIWR
jgi:hypothetical protein